MSWLSFLTGGAGSLVDSIGNAIDNNITSDEERLKLRNELVKLNQDFTLKAYEFQAKEDEITQKDRESARNRELEIIKAGGSSKILYVLIVLLFLFVMALTGWILTHDIPTGVNEMITLVLGGLLAKLTDIYGYYFGSSRGSALKDETIRKQA